MFIRLFVKAADNLLIILDKCVLYTVWPFGSKEKSKYSITDNSCDLINEQ